MSRVRLGLLQHRMRLLTFSSNLYNNLLTSLDQRNWAVNVPPRQVSQYYRPIHGCKDVSVEKVETRDQFFLTVMLIRIYCGSSSRDKVMGPDSNAGYEKLISSTSSCLIVFAQCRCWGGKLWRFIGPGRCHWCSGARPRQQMRSPNLRKHHYLMMSQSIVTNSLPL